MAQKKNRDKVNFSNPKVKTLISYMMLCENRLSRESILQIATKDILYQMKNSGYIKECSNGIFIATDKLHKYVKEKEGKSFASSGSAEHSDKVRQSLNLLPKEVLQRKDFVTSTDIEKRFKRYQKTDEYKKYLQNLKKLHGDNLDAVKERHRTFYSTDEAKRYEENIIYEREREKCLISLQYLNDRVCLTPDYEVTMNRGEVEQYISNLEAYADTLVDVKQYRMYEESIRTLQNLIADESRDSYTIACEVTTDCYLNREIELHKNYSYLTDMPLIFV